MDKIGVAGCGLMGSGIAEVAARAELDVVVVESNQPAADAGRQRLAASLRRAEAKGKVADAAAVLERVRIVTDLDALADRDIVVEAIVED
ncbi:MAG TPA: 3-hydroxyacyl-CoA dehydrogenase NAD-binding domain-containing protein, partial [Micromonosporaceae bacterium]|nr:3-hydroxyacyl-CoA dehydrogenase NAD-binding domain-containing protein [Micromonosporaceae bacterium]